MTACCGGASELMVRPRLQDALRGLCCHQARVAVLSQVLGADTSPGPSGLVSVPRSQAQAEPAGLALQQKPQGQAILQAWPWSPAS